MPAASPAPRSTAESPCADFDCDIRSSAVAVLCGPDVSSLSMFFALMAKSAPPPSIATEAPARAYVQVRRVEEGSDRIAVVVVTVGAGNADAGAAVGCDAAGCDTAGLATGCVAGVCAGGM